MKQSIYILLVCTVLAMMAACTHSSETKDNVKAKAAWQQYYKAYHAKDLKRTLTVIDSMETEKIVSTPKADYLRGIAYDQGWQMKIAEHFYQKSYHAYASDPSQDWGTYADAGYRSAYLRFRRGDTEGVMNVTTGLLQQAKGNEAFSKGVASALLMLMAQIQLQLHQYNEACLTGQKVYEVVQQNVDNGEASELDVIWACMNIFDIYHEAGDMEGAMVWLDYCTQAFAHAEQAHNDSLKIRNGKAM